MIFKIYLSYVVFIKNVDEIGNKCIRLNIIKVILYVGWCFRYVGM